MPVARHDEDDDDDDDDRKCTLKVIMSKMRQNFVINNHFFQNRDITIIVTSWLHGSYSIERFVNISIMAFQADFDYQIGYIFTPAVWLVSRHRIK